MRSKRHTKIHVNNGWTGRHFRRRVGTWKSVIVRTEFNRSVVKVWPVPLECNGVPADVSPVGPCLVLQSFLPYLRIALLLRYQSFRTRTTSFNEPLGQAHEPSCDTQSKQAHTTCRDLLLYDYIERSCDWSSCLTRAL